MQAVSHEEEVLKLQEKLQAHITDEQRSLLSSNSLSFLPPLSPPSSTYIIFLSRHILEEDIEKIRLQREVQSNSSALQQSTDQCKSLQMVNKKAKTKFFMYPI